MENDGFDEFFNRPRKSGKDYRTDESFLKLVTGSQTAREFYHHMFEEMMVGMMRLWPEFKEGTPDKSDRLKYIGTIAVLADLLVMFVGCGSTPKNVKRFCELVGVNVESFIQLGFAYTEWEEESGVPFDEEFIRKYSGVKEAMRMLSGFREQGVDPFRLFASESVYHKVREVKDDGKEGFPIDILN